MKAAKTIFTLLSAFLVLFSSTSFMVGVHVCMGELQEIAVFSKAEGCAMEQSLPPCHRHTKAPCCEDEVISHDADSFKASVQEVDFSPVVTDPVIATMVLIAEIIPAALHQQAFPDYDPPLPTVDFTITHRVLLI